MLTNKALVDRAQKVSLYSWFGASCCTIAAELTEILRAALPAILVRTRMSCHAVHRRCCARSLPVCTAQGQVALVTCAAIALPPALLLLHNLRAGELMLT